jgi:hypothetical protein
VNNPILAGVLEKLCVPDLCERIINSLSFSEIQSLLLEILDKKTQELKPHDIFKQFLDDGYVRPSAVQQTRYLYFDAMAMSLLPVDFQAIELSPVSPLGCCSQIANFSQKRIISTIRKNEVSSDPTNVLALEAARQKGRHNPAKIVKLATSQRVLRSERKITLDSFAHFKLFCICLAGYDRGNLEFETTSTLEVVQYYDRLLAALQINGYEFSSPEMVIHCQNERILNSIQNSMAPLPHLSLAMDLAPDENWNYYSGIRFQLFIQCKGERWFIADGGDTDWTQKILSNKKERLLISGFGSERFIALTDTNRPIEP